MTEQWRPVVGYEGFFEVSDMGRVRSLSRRVKRGNHWLTVPGRVLKATVKDTGHLVCGLNVDGVGVMRYVHRLVLEAFVGPAPEGAHCCHANDVKADNRLSNLRWDTPSANAYDASRNGLNWLAQKTHCASGHEFTEANTYRKPSGHRQCRACGRAAVRCWEARKAERTAA